MKKLHISSERNYTMSSGLGGTFTLKFQKQDKEGDYVFDIINPDFKGEITLCPKVAEDRLSYSVHTMKASFDGRMWYLSDGQRFTRAKKLIRYCNNHKIRIGNMKEVLVPSEYLLLKY